MFSMTQLVRRCVQTRGSGLATCDGDRNQTWSEFEACIGRLAGGLRKLGVKDGERVAILALNSDHYYELLFAVPWAGGVFVPVNTRLAGPEVIYWLNDSQSKILFVDRAFVDLVTDIRSRLTSVESIVFIGEKPDGAEVPEGYLPYIEIVSQVAIEDANRKNDDMAGLYYTGGTTGRSKGVMLSHTNLVANALQSLPVIQVEPGARTLHVAPMFHIADGWICMTSAVMACANYFRPAFDPKETLQAIQQHGIQRMLLVPTMVNMMVHQEDISDYDLSSLNSVAYGASPMPESVIRRAMQVMPNTRFFQAYGQTEASPALTLLPPERHVFEGELAGKMKSAGQAIPGVDLAILDGSDQKLPAGEIGEICARGANVMLGYRNLPEQTATALGNGWLHTGDGGYMDEEGFVFIVDRVKDMIVSGGENVYSSEVENAIYQVPGVDQCAVIGIPHDKWGEQVHAVVVPKEGEKLSEEDIIEFCRGQIAGFKCPRSISFQSQPLPLSGAGKILKTELRKPFWQDRDKGVN